MLPITPSLDRDSELPGSLVLEWSEVVWVTCCYDPYFTLGYQGFGQLSEGTPVHAERRLVGRRSQAASPWPETKDALVESQVWKGITTPDPLELGLVSFHRASGNCKWTTVLACPLGTRDRQNHLEWGGRAAGEGFELEGSLWARTWSLRQAAE